MSTYYVLDKKPKSKFNVYTADQVFDRVGSLNKFQLIAALMCVISYSFDGYTVYTIALLTLMPDFRCVKNGEESKCTANITCQTTFNNFLKNGENSSIDPTQNGYYINWDSQTSLHNWVEPLNLRCATQYQIGFFGSVFFMGLGIGTLTLAHLGDQYGRIRLLRIGLFLSLVAFGCIIFVQVSFYFTYVFLFFLGFLSPIRLNLSFIYGSEVFKEQHASIMGSLSLCMDSFTMIIASVYFKYISKDWSYLYYFFFSICCIPLIISYFMPESPRYLLQKRLFNDARASFNKIAQINRKQPLSTNDKFWSEIQVDKLDVSNKNNTLSTIAYSDSTRPAKGINQSALSDVLSVKKYQINYGALLLAWCASSYSYYMIGFYLKYVPGDIYQNYIVSAIAEAIACQVAGPLAIKYGSSKTMTASFILGGTFGLLLSFIDEKNSIHIISSLLIAKFGVSTAISLCYVLTTFYFPILHSSKVFSYLCAKGKFFAMLAPLVAEIQGHVPLISMAIACLLSSMSAFLLEKHHEDEDDDYDHEK
ncbi:organic cation [Stylonychia lemnae]|uniref:Organic cation n=1 Tax=Stylonychia lemnae TaxID=5949 RepID=A0A078B125_STYLE|nr:organic cation [Stylonychia lemnae]|eukprot:CDW88264.1 organic cation [Stylonychia lemnae]